MPPTGPFMPPSRCLEAPFRTSSAGLGSPGPCFRTSLARLRAVEGRIRTCEAREEYWDAEHGVEWRARGAEARIAGRNRVHLVPTKQWTITQGRGGIAQALWFSEGIRPLPMRRHPKRRFRPTRALGLALRRGRHPLRHREVGQKRLGGAPPPPATPSCAVAGRCARHQHPGKDGARQSARHRRSPDTGNMISRCDRYALETR